MSADPHDPLSALRFQVEAGVDLALSEAPVDRFALSRAQADARGAPARAPAREPVPHAAVAEPEAEPAPVAAPAFAVPSGNAVMAAREAAASAGSLDELRATLERFEGCNLRHTATNLVFGDGNPQARIMFVGEAPGMDEDLQGRPFVGRSGQLLDRMMAAIGLDRTAAYIANVIPWRPPGNRDPSPQETEICKPFIARQIELVDPAILVFLGNASTKQLLQTSEGITRMRGRWRDYPVGARPVPAMPTFHPAYLLRQPLQKKLAWRDLLAVKRALDDLPAA